MNNTFSHRAFSTKHEKSYQEMSTAQKFYDLEETQKHYEELKDQNLWLKSKINMNKQYSKNQAEFSETCQLCVQERTANSSTFQKHQTNDILQWSMMERNKFLEAKVGKLKNQYERQNRQIGKIKNSQKWQNKLVCTSKKQDCYMEKYINLMRAKSPLI